MDLYFKAVGMHIKTSCEYKLSSIINFIAQFFVMFSDYFIIIALFSKFGNIKGFTLYEILLCYSIIQLGYSINDVFFKGLDDFSDIIINGMFDRLLVRPRSLLIQILASKVSLVRTSRIIQCIGIMIYSIINLDLELNLIRVIVLLLMISGSVVIFFSILLLMSGLSFFTVQGLEIKSLFTYGGKQIAQYPIAIFKKYIVLFFTFVIPYGLVNYYPYLYFLGRNDNVFYAFAPLGTLIFLGISLVVFKLSSNKYVSTGS